MYQKFYRKCQFQKLLGWLEIELDSDSDGALDGTELDSDSNELLGVLLELLTETIDDDDDDEGPKAVKKI